MTPEPNADRIASHPSTASTGHPVEDGVLRAVFESVFGVPFSDGNTVEVLRNGKEIFPAMLEAIEDARERVRLLTFVYWEGDIAERFADALAARARAGVNVEVLLDDVGCLEMPEELVTRMRAAGAEVRRFRPMRKLHLSRVNNRTHRKVLVCDGAVGFTGGVGIAEEWEGDAEGPGNWRETHFRVRGPAVRGLDAAFLENWLEAEGALDLSHDPLVSAERPGGIPVQVLKSQGSAPFSAFLAAAQLLPDVARVRLRIQTAYFVPDEATTEALVEAARRGVAVEVMLPGAYSDHRLCNFAGRSVFERLLEAGVRIWLYQRTMLHAKVVTLDGRAAFVGSPNFNHRSARRDDEIALLLLDEKTTEKLDAHFQEDLDACVAIDPKRWPRRGHWARSKEWLAAHLRSEL